MKYFPVYLFGFLLLTGCLPKKPAPDVARTLVLDVSENWQFKKAGDQQWMPARVPGTVHTDLLANGTIEDPFFRCNEKKQQWIDKADWEYQCTFYISDSMLSMQHIDLQFEGLDTYADVYLNDQKVLEADNMFRTWRKSIKDQLKKGENIVYIKFHSPTAKGLERVKRNGYPLPASNDQSQNGEMGNQKVSPFVRKAPYHFGWDWAPRLVTSGIWKDVKIIAWSDIILHDAFVRTQKIYRKEADMMAVLAIESQNEKDIEITITDDRNQFINLKEKVDSGQNTIHVPFTIRKPKLWWPNGMGEQNLYNIYIELSNDSILLASKRIRTGVREIDWIREPDSLGTSFYVRVNGKRVFAKGANYIPNDVFVPSVRDQKYLHVLQSAADAHMNMIRVWGGGIYECNRFYELCDSLGLMVWQDFMFACSMYPGDHAFLENVRKEAIDNVKRLRNHPSIAIWCGNNEIEVAWAEGEEGKGWGWKERYNSRQRKEIYQAYDTLFYSILPGIVQKFHPDVFYWPSSPLADHKQIANYSSTSGDMHYWGVWHGKEKFEAFENHIPRFMSEYGFQSFPEFQSVKKYTLPEDWDIESEVMASHQRSGIGNLRIKEYMEWYYPVPRKFEDFLYLGQVLQAEGIKLGIEAHRRNKPYCMGTLYWHLNDCWPVASWSSIDYYGRWKALHYVVKKAYEPFLVSIHPVMDSLEVYVVSDEYQEENAKLHIALQDFFGAIYFEDEVNLSLAADSSQKAYVFPISNGVVPIDSTSMVFIADLKIDSKVISSRYYFARPKHMQIHKARPKMDLVTNKNETLLTIACDTLIKNLFLYDDSSRYTFSDNYFDVLPKREYHLKVASDKGQKVDLKQIQYKSLADI